MLVLDLELRVRVQEARSSDTACETSRQGQEGSQGKRKYEQLQARL